MQINIIHQHQFILETNPVTINQPLKQISSVGFIINFSQHHTSNGLLIQPSSFSLKHVLSVTKLNNNLKRFLNHGKGVHSGEHSLHTGAVTRHCLSPLTTFLHMNKPITTYTVAFPNSYLLLQPQRTQHWVLDQALSLLVVRQI